MTQTKKQTVREVLADTFIGIVLAGIVNWSVLITFREVDPNVTAVVLTVVFTIMSIIRKYCTRRFFNKRDG